MGRLSYFRADAEEDFADQHQRQMIYAIEEPETSQHPDYQKMILDTFVEISQKKSHQIIMTTHTPEIAKMVFPEQLIYIVKNDAGQSQVEKDTEKKISGIVETLGVLPYAQTQTVIYVEGPNDVNFLVNLNQNIPELKSIIDLKKSDIRIIPLRGGRLVDWVNKNYFEGSSLKEIHIFDNDVDEYRELIATILESNDKRRYGWTTHLPEMENYIPLSLVEQEFNIDLKKHQDTWTETDLPKLLVSVCKQDIKDVEQREIVIKQILNGSTSKLIRKEHLESLGVWDEVEEWFKKINSFHNGTLKRWIIETSMSKDMEYSEV